MSSFDSHFWFARSRMGAWDVPSKAYKMFINKHFIENLPSRKLFMPTTIGWWAIWDWTPKQRIRLFPDDMEYLLCKSLASDSSLAWTESFTPRSIKNSYNQQRLAAMIVQYEDLRLSNYFSQEVKKKLAEIGQDFTLEKAGDSKWQFRPVNYDKHQVAAIDGQSNVWKAQNKYNEQPVKLRIEAKLSLARYDDANGVTVEDFNRPADYSEKQLSPQVSCSLESVSTPIKAGTISACYTVKNGQADAMKAWSLLAKTFKSSIDFTKRGFGVWIYGDGNSEVLNLMWKGPANSCWGIDEHYVDVDFTGWKYFEFIEPESDRVGTYNWPYRRATYLEGNWVTYDNIVNLTLGCINIPSGKEVKCYISPIKALEHITVKLSNPSVTIGDSTVTFPLQLESGSYLEFRSMTDCKVYGPKGEFVCEVKPQGEVPVLKAGENQIEFNCGIDSAVKARATVTVISQDDTVLRR
jgi:hypothetical protein